MSRISKFIIPVLPFILFSISETQSNEGGITVAATVVFGLSIDIIESAEGVDVGSTDEMHVTLRGDYELVLEFKGDTGFSYEYLTIQPDQFYAINNINRYSEITIQVVSH